MLWIHPILAAASTLLAFYVLLLGLTRFGNNHLGRGNLFQWRRHVLLGQIAYLGWLLSFAGGAFMVWLNWPDAFLKGEHTEGALNLLVLLALGFATGQYMNLRPKRRTLLPLVHAGLNIWILVLALGQAVTGWGIIQKALLN